MKRIATKTVSKQLSNQHLMPKSRQLDKPPYWRKKAMRIALVAINP